MNKFVVLVLLFLTVANAQKGLKDHTYKRHHFPNGINRKANDLNKKVNDKAKDLNKKANDAIEKVEDAVEKAKDKAEDVKKAVDNTTKNIKRDFVTLQADMKQLVNNIEYQFKQIATDAEKAILSAKKWSAATNYKDVNEWYKNYKKEIDKYYSALKNDIDIAAANAKNNLNKFGADVSVLYKDGRLVVVESAKDASAAIKALKKQNKECMEKSVTAINNSIEQAKSILKVMEKELTEDDIYMSRSDVVTTNKEKLWFIKLTLEVLPKKIGDELKKFTANVKASIKDIRERSEELLESAKALGSDLLGKNIVTEIKEEKSEDVKNIKIDFATLQSDFKQLIRNIEYQFKRIATNAEEAILSAKKWSAANYKDVNEWYKNYRNEIEKYYSFIQFEIDDTAANAKDFLNKFGVDVSVLYKDGRLVVVEAAKDASAAIKALKKQNKESLEKSVTAINDSIEQAKRILKVMEEKVSAQDKAMDSLRTNKDKRDYLKLAMDVLADNIDNELKKFTANVKASVKKINDRCEELLKSAKALGTDLLGKNIVTEIKEEKSFVKSAFDKIKKLWNSF